MKINFKHKLKVEERKYVYLFTYEVGEYTIDRHHLIKTNRTQYMRVICPYCNKEYDVHCGGFINNKKNCGHCCHEYENSFAYHIQVELGESLNKYWDWEKNDVNPYLIYKRYGKNVWTKCEIHGVNKITPYEFTSNNNKCSICKKHKPLMYLNKKHKVTVENNGFIYIGTYSTGMTTIDGKLNTRNYIRIKCKYCGNEYDVLLYGMVKGDGCGKCCNHYHNSFAYHIECELGLNLYDVWDFNNNTLNPYYISMKTDKTIWIKCMEKGYHGSYKVRCCSFVYGNRCPYCSNQHGRVHPNDSFGALHNDLAKHWNYDKNNKTPFEVAPSANRGFWFKCDTCGRDTFKSLNSLTNKSRKNIGLKCNECNSSSGEIRIINFLNSIGYVVNEDYIHDKCYFEDLLSKRKNKLRPDFVIPKIKLWIEYDGKQHDEWRTGMMTYEEFLMLQENDRIKNEYAKTHGWLLIRIKEEDYDNVENILMNEINKIGGFSI